MRALKPLRWFKLARVMKLFKFNEILSFAFDYLMLAPSHQRRIMVVPEREGKRERERERVRARESA